MHDEERSTVTYVKDTKVVLRSTFISGLHKYLPGTIGVARDHWYNTRSPFGRPDMTDVMFENGVAYTVPDDLLVMIESEEYTWLW